jgi:16S rRNA (cytidine1402-2'-O)-methyltransferase
LGAKTDKHGESPGGDGQLYVVATPVGNLDDISLRALKVLADVDLIAAEDTRTTNVLLARHGIRTQTMAAHEHNERGAAERIADLLAQGRNVALVSDAGTPGISDPGALVVGHVRAAGFRVTPIPGASAAIAALSVAGLQQGRFLFAGFLPVKAAARRKEIASLSDFPWPLVFYESPHRIVECVEDLAAGLDGDRQILIARELTKLFEEIHRCPLAEAAAWLRADTNRERGEFVLIVDGMPERVQQDLAESERVLALLLDALPLAQAVKLACAVTGAKRNDLYPRALELAAARKV